MDTSHFHERKTAARSERVGTPRSYSTDEAAAIVQLKPQTLRHELCVKGAFRGIRPVKLPGGNRLLWPADKIDALARGERP